MYPHCVVKGVHQLLIPRLLSGHIVVRPQPYPRGSFWHRGRSPMLPIRDRTPGERTGAVDRVGTVGTWTQNPKISPFPRASPPPVNRLLHRLHRRLLHRLLRRNRHQLRRRLHLRAPPRNPELRRRSPELRRRNPPPLRQAPRRLPRRLIRPRRLLRANGP